MSVPELVPDTLMFCGDSAADLEYGCLVCESRIGPGNVLRPVSEICLVDEGSGLTLTDFAGRTLREQLRGKGKPHHIMGHRFVATGSQLRPREHHYRKISPDSLPNQMIGDPDCVGDDSKRGIYGACRDEAGGVDDIEVIDIMGLAKSRTLGAGSWPIRDGGMLRNAGSL